MVKRGLKLWSVNTGAYYEEAQKLFAKGVYDYIELYVIPGSLETLEKWKQLEIPFIIHHAHSMQGFNLADAAKKESNRIIYNETKVFADELKAPYIIFHGGMDGDIKETARQLRSFDDSRALIENKPGVPVTDKFGFEKCRGALFEELAFVMAETGCGFCLDFGHAVCAANTYGEEPYSYIEKLTALQPTMFHLTDVSDMSSEIDAHPHLGDGELDIRRIMAFIPENALVTFETNKNAKDNLNDFVKDMEWLKRL